MIEANKTYFGPIVDNNDPDRLGRVKIEVMGVFDGMKPEDIPWANPWKDLNGNSVNIPDKGKIVTVVFENGDENSPEYIYADHYNINLENKLKELDVDDYKSMKSLLFDHKTQIYVNDNEGLKIDYLYNNINIDNKSINLNLKDNNSYVNIGDDKADQQMILGTAFLNWFENFIDSIATGGLLNSGGPVIGTPAFTKLYSEFKALKDIAFLSHHVNIVDNDKVNLRDGINRKDEPIYGDEWSSNTMENTTTTISSEDYSPKAGPNENFNQDTTAESDIEPTLSDDIFTTLSDNLHSIIDKDNKINDIISLYDSIQNKADIDKLHSSFGKKDGLNLKEYISKNFEESELKILNNIFKEKGMTFRYTDLNGNIH